MSDTQHLPPDDGGWKPVAPPPKPSDARRSVTPPSSAARTRRSFSDRELTQLQETGTVLVNSGLLVDGIRLTAITAALSLLGIEVDDVVLHAAGHDIAVTVKPDA